ncbi:MAG: hypothetical protein JSV78_06935 [Phycisphaerales bacterium]|nr:MAG: hypothetical protein JSV78_06935 [Phycisphaerales bacterium]
MNRQLAAAVLILTMGFLTLIWCCTPSDGDGNVNENDSVVDNQNDNVIDNENDNADGNENGNENENLNDNDSPPPPPPDADPIESLPIPLNIMFPDGATGSTPVTVGVPMPVEVAAAEDLTVVGPDGPVPTQIREMVRLGDADGMCWLLVDFQADSGRTYELASGDAPVPAMPVEVTEGLDGTVVVDTGAGTWEIPANSSLLANVLGPGGETLVSGATWDEETAAELEIVEQGPMRAMLRVRAREAVSGLDLTGRLHFFAGLPYARVRITLTNHDRCPTWAEAPDSDNGECNFPQEGQPACNGLLSAGGIAVEDVTWSLTLANTPDDVDEVIYQDSSGTNAWDYYVGLGPRMQSNVTSRGFRHMRGGSHIDEGDAADGSLTAGGVRLFVPWFRELFPKALRCRDGRLEFGIFPGEFAAQHRLRAGEQKTHDVYVCLDSSADPVWPVYAAPALGWLRHTNALGYLGPRVRGTSGTTDDYEDYLDNQFDTGAHTENDCNNDLDDCARSIFDARERWDYYGWTDFGDMPTDFENSHSPYNLKYDINLGFLQQALRTGDGRWWHLAHAGNIHFADIDILHSRIRGYEADRDWFNGGSWGHSYHNEVGLSNPHRNCANPHPDTTWGGSGMAAWCLLTGDDMVREAAVELADNTLWRLQNTSDTACAVEAWGGGNGGGFVVWEEERPPSRPVANSGRLLVWAYRLTGDEAYMDTAAGVAHWVDCERDRFRCAYWPEALLVRGIGEYILTARQSGLAVDPIAEPTLIQLLDLMTDNMEGDSEYAWLMNCVENYPEINAWMFLIADAFAHGYAVTGDESWLEDYARPCFNTAGRDPYYEGDTSQYHTSKEIANTVPNGTAYLHFVHGGRP